MTDKKENDPIAADKLSRQSQQKLEEIRQQQGFSTIEETIKYLT
ncbi:hypothetical protein [Companilactobacillus sp. FL22-1]